MNKIILKYELDLDFVLIAVTSPLRDYRICHFINKYTGLRFKKTEDYILNGSSSFSNKYFSMYTYEVQGFETVFYFMSNRGIDGGLLVPELKTSDYFILIKGFIDEEDMENLLQQLNSIPDVLVASEISPQKLKSRENLVF